MMNLAPFITVPLAWAYLLLLLLGYLSLGWLLAAFQVCWFVWVGTLGVILHLITAKTDAIAIASAWVVAIVSIAAVVKAWTPLWDSRVPSEHAQLWAIGLLLIWLWAHILVLLLAFARKPMRRLNIQPVQATQGLIVLIGVALVLGELICRCQLRQTLDF